MTQTLETFAPAPPDTHPPLDYPDYRSTRLRHPNHDPIHVDPGKLDRGELSGPLFGESAVTAADADLTIGPSGRVQAGIKAREVVVLGQIQGNVEAMDKLDIRKEAKLVGDIKTARIIIEDGAYFKGSIDIVRQEAKKQAAAPAPAGRPAVPGDHGLSRPDYGDQSAEYEVGAGDLTEMNPADRIGKKWVRHKQWSHAAHEGEGETDADCLGGSSIANHPG